MPDQQRVTFNWGLWLQWVVATTLAWVLAWILPIDLIFVGLGLVLGLLQWLVLRQHLSQAGWWVLASGVGWALGWVLAFVAISPEVGILAGTVVGASVGVAQWLVLRRERYQAGWWIAVSILGWTVGLVGFMGIFLVGAVAGAVTGVALELLLRYPGLLRADRGAPLYPHTLDAKRRDK
jgi:hypothetical protein